MYYISTKHTVKNIIASAPDASTYLFQSLTITFQTFGRISYSFLQAIGYQSTLDSFTNYFNNNTSLDRPDWSRHINYPLTPPTLWENRQIFPCWVWNIIHYNPHVTLDRSWQASNWTLFIHWTTWSFPTPDWALLSRPCFNCLLHIDTVSFHW